MGFLSVFSRDVLHGKSCVTNVRGGNVTFPYEHRVLSSVFHAPFFIWENSVVFEEREVTMCLSDVDNLVENMDCKVEVYGVFEFMVIEWISF